MFTQVFVRLRPLKAQEGDACLSSRSPAEVCAAGADGRREEFKFDRVYPEEAIQEDVFEGVKHIVHSVLEDGYNGTIMAYGQTSAGKTHTMFGASAAPGIVPRAAALAASLAAASSGCSYKFSASVVEIYNERCRDLLAPANDNLQVFQDAGGVRVPGMAAVEVATEAEAMAAVARGLGARATGATAMNDASSRSHCLVVLGVERTWTDGRTQRSKLCLVDLAGSERQSKTGAQGLTLKEGQNINKSLLVLGSVVNALCEGGGGAAPGRVPYRDSKLTRLLQDSLGGTSRTAIVVCASPAAANYAESLAALRFGARARAVQSKVAPNAIASGMGAGGAAAAAEIAALRKELEAARRGGGRGCGAEGALGKETRVRQTMLWAVTVVAQTAGLLVLFAADRLCAARSL